MKFIRTIPLLLASLSISNAWAAKLELLPQQFESPVLLTHSNTNDDRLFVVEKTGHVYLLENSFSKKSLYIDASSLITTRGNEQGLLSIAFHPEFKHNGYLFIYYTAKNGDNTLARLTVSLPESMQVNLDSLEVLFAEKDPASNHNGGMLTFGHDGYLYLGMGDGGRGGDPWNNAQNLQNRLGKLLRINVNSASGYTIPQDNPFLANKQAKPEIWAYGLRNPWRHSFDSLTGDLWIADVGQEKWEEINLQSADSKGGENYGWKMMEGKHCYAPKKDCDNGKLTHPVAEYSHKQGCSITGGYVYRGENIPSIVGKYIYADFCSGTIWGIDQNLSFSVQVVMQTELNISSFGEDASGEIYLLDYNGGIYKFVP